MKQHLEIASMCFLMKFIIALVIFLKCNSADEFLKYIISKERLFISTNKTWHFYVEKVLEQCSRNNSYKMFNIKQEIYFIKKNLYHFLRYSKQPIDLKSKCQIVNKVTGRIVEKSFELSGIYFFQAYIEYTVFWHTWKFLLDKSFSLNFTVHDLKFSVGYFQLGNLTFFVNKMMKGDEELLSYAGHVSKMCVYPVDFNVDIKLYFQRSVTYILNASFSVIDSKSIQLTHIADTSLHSHVSMYKIHDKYSVLSYQIQVRKTQYIVFKCLYSIINKIIVFDGPGLLSKKLNTESNILHSSSFLCMVQLLTSDDKRHIYLNYSSKNIFYVNELHFHNSFTIKIPDASDFTFSTANHQTPQSYAFAIMTKEPLQINASVIYLYQETAFSDSVDCRYGGLLAAEYIRNTYTDGFILCEYRERNMNLSRNFYSQNSSLILVVYSFHHYSKMTAKIKITKTKCQSVHLDPCMIQDFCVQFPTLHQQTLCNKYIKNMTQFVDLEIIHKRNPSSFRYAFFFSSFNDNCYVIQLHVFQQNSIASHDPLQCSINFMPEATTDHDQILQFQVRGVLEPLREEMEEQVTLSVSDYKFKISSRSSFSATGIKDVSIQPLKWKSLSIELALIGQSWLELITSVGSRKLITSEVTKNIVNISQIILSDQDFVTQTGNLLQHVMVYQIKTNGTKTNVSTYIQIFCSYNRVNNLELRIDHLQLSTNKGFSFISVPERIFHQHIFQVKFPGQFEIESVSPSKIEQGWISHEYDKYKSYLNAEARNISSKSQVKFHSTLNKVSFLFMKTGSCSTEDKISWNEAFKCCRYYKGHLPYFTSREELQDFIALIKLSSSLPPLEAVYIDLKISWNSPVLFWSHGAPLTFQQFSNFNFGKIQSVTYLCFARESGQMIDFLDVLNPEQQKCVDLMEVKDKTRSSIYPHRINQTTCVMMLLSNLAEPQWIQINCDQRLFNHFFCTSHNTTLTKNMVKEPVQKESCLPINIEKDKKCLLLLWYNRSTNKSLAEACKAKLHSSKTFINIKYYQFLLAATDANFPPLLIEDKNNESLAYNVSCSKLVNTYICEKPLVAIQNSEGFHLCSRNKKEFLLDSRLYHCKHGSYILISYLCDGIIDCPNDMSDEEHCVHNSSQSFPQGNFNNYYIFISNGKRQCSLLYYMSNKGLCFKYSNNPAIESANSTFKNVLVDGLNFTCSNGLKLHHSQVDDLVADCGPTGEDEPKLLELLTNGVTFHCPKYQLPCKKGHSKCFNVIDICVYRLDEKHAMYPCKNGAHLQNCKMFECNLNYKCENSYCIPWSYVCDGKWDCPSGEDENYMPVCGDNNICINMYKCRNTKHRCVHIGSVCDGYVDCPFQDDEQLCELQDIICPSTCQCLSLAIVCVKRTKLLPSDNFPFISVVIQNAVRLSWNHLTEVFPNALIISIKSNNLDEVCSISLSKSVLFINLGNNKVAKISYQCFIDLPKLQMILLDNNQISVIESHSIVRLSKLKFISLSNNRLLNLPKSFIFGSPELRILSVRFNEFSNIEAKAFDNLDVKIIATEDTHICCIAPAESKCTSIRPWYRSCSNLLPSNSIKVLFITVSILIFSGNCLSIILGILAKNSGKAFALTVIFINMNDILCFVYLCIIWIADVVFGEEFLVREEHWRSGPVCFAAFGAICCFTISTPSILLFLALARLHVVLYPMDSKFKRTEFTVRALTILCLLSALIGFSFTLLMKFISGTLPMNLCIPFIDPTGSYIFLKVFVWLTIIYQSVMSFIIFALHMLLVKELKNQEKNLGNAKSRKTSDIPMLVQLIVLTTSNIICWFPTNVVYILAIVMTKYSIKIVFWTTVTVLPINSVVNPIVFILLNTKRLYVKQKSSQNVANVSQQTRR